MLVAANVVRAACTNVTFFQVRFENKLGWMQYKKKSTLILVPALNRIKKFWADCEIWDSAKYYRVRTTLPLSTEVKVGFTYNSSPFASKLTHTHLPLISFRL